MFIRIDSKTKQNNIGNKAQYLINLHKQGFNVPNGFILDSSIYNQIIEYNNLSDSITSIIQSINLDNLSDSSTTLLQLFERISIPINIISELNDVLNERTLYAVRSSGTKEDLDTHSFAGQYNTFLNVHKNDVYNSIIDCYKSMFSEVILSYFINNNISFDNLSMSVIVQEMVDADKSGIVFTINPLTGNDKEMVIEIASGLGDNIVSGKAIPESYLYNWFDNTYLYNEQQSLLDEKLLNELTRISLNIMLSFGTPVDIEFAIKDNIIYILQARAITKIMYSSIVDQWSTADFKDGGVSSSVCTPYMWSLYEYIWETTLRKFMVESKLLPNKKIRKLGDMFYGRPYWNMTMVKSAMSNVPGYKERQFDEEFGVKITYEGNGNTTNYSAKILLKIALIAIKQMKIVRTHREAVSNLKSEFLTMYNDYFHRSKQNNNLNETESIWLKLINDDYLRTEGTYFWQIFINTVQQSLFKDKLLKHTDIEGYFNLISGLTNISHLLPFYDMWDISRMIRNNEESYQFWLNSSNDQITECYNTNSNVHFLDQVHNYINLYGYHSDKELDVTYPCYYEEPSKVIKMLKDTVQLDDDCSPLFDKSKQTEIYHMQLEMIASKTNKKVFNKIKDSIVKIREMLWWREELRDISTRFYYIIRIYTLKLAKHYYDIGVINNINDIWYLKINDIERFIKKEITSDEIRRIIERNVIYYQSFRNFKNENEIGTIFDNHTFTSSVKSSDLKGLGCNSGIVTGTARVIDSLKEIDKLEVGDILITKFTDTGWTSKFAILNGIVTEYGGILCHAAIISREYGIPCVVCCNDATTRIVDGSTVTINGATGEIIIVKE